MAGLSSSCYEHIWLGQGQLRQLQRQQQAAAVAAATAAAGSKLAHASGSIRQPTRYKRTRSMQCVASATHASNGSKYSGFLQCTATGVHSPVCLLPDHNMQLVLPAAHLIALCYSLS
jgi:hypothetical protein